MQFPITLTNPALKLKQCKKTLPIIILYTSSKPPYFSQSQRRLFATGTNSQALTTLKQVHAFVLKTRTVTAQLQRHFQPSLFSSSEPIIAYFCHILKHVESHDLSLHLCNEVLRGVSSKSSGDSSHAMVLVREMVSHGFVPDEYTVPFALKACARSRAIREGLQIHAYAVKAGLVVSNVYVKNTVMRLYAVCGFVDSVRLLFDESSQRDLITWTTLIQCYVEMGFSMEGVEAFFAMVDSNVKADEMTVVVVLSACAKLGDLTLGEKIHSYICDNRVTLDVFVGNALVDMYFKCGDTESAWKVFDAMGVRNVVSWNSLISGLAHQGLFEDALSMFRKMQSKGVEPDDFTLVCVLNSCSNLGMLELGKWVHVYIDRNRIRADGFIGNALVDMYAKCGSIGEAFRVFEGMKNRDVYSYTSVIVGLATHGEAQRALTIFSKMHRVGIKPDEVTFIGVLTACSHAGLVAEGMKYFREMSRVYNLRPQTEHYGCMVDLLGRAGLIEEAEELIRSMPMEADANVWGALLGACKIHGHVELGEDVMKKLVEVEPERDGAYVLMSNMYSSANKWRDAVKLRKEMKDMKLKKTPGCSSIEVDGVVYEFRKGDKSNLRSRELYNVLDEITIHLKE